MVRLDLSGINTVRRKLASGEWATYYYHRATGRRLRGKPGSDDFLADYQAAVASIRSTDRNNGALQSVISAYCASTAFTELRPTTQADYRKQIGKIEDEFADLPIAALNDPAVRGEFLDWRDKLAGRSKRQADAAIVMLGTIIAWGIDRASFGITANHAARPGRLYKSQRADKIWTDEHIAAFRKVASPEMSLALLLALETGQREGDLLALSRRAYDGARITLRQSKGNKPIPPIKVTAELKAALDALDHDAVTLLADDRGRPWNQNLFLHRWRKTFIEAGLKDTGLHFHDLRGTFATRAFEAGATVAEVAEVTGHTLATAQAILDHYLARTGRMGDAAIHKIERLKKVAAAKRLQNARKGKMSGGA